MSSKQSVVFLRIAMGLVSRLFLAMDCGVFAGVCLRTSDAGRAAVLESESNEIPRGGIHQRIRAERKGHQDPWSVLQHLRAVPAGVRETGFDELRPDRAQVEKSNSLGLA